MSRIGLYNPITMRRIQAILRAGNVGAIALSLLLAGLPQPVQADVANVSSLIISQAKVTSSNGQFITLYNASGQALEMDRYRLEYFNNYNLSEATSSKLVSLSGVVPPHGYFMIVDGPVALCYQATVDSVSLGFSSLAGLVEVLAFNQTTPGSPVTPVLQDSISWSKTTMAGIQTLPGNDNAFLRRQPLDVTGNPAINAPGSGTWQTIQPDPDDPCKLYSASGSLANIQPASDQLLPPVEPPATIVSTTDEPANAPPGLPPGDSGLKSPQITEILPNPNGTGNDGTDEFVELYNPNKTSFDLSNFSLQSGTKSLHHFAFPSGMQLAPGAFTSFYSAKTGLSLSNSGGQVKLLDPYGNAIAATGVYGDAKDGLSWALAKGQWYWTLDPTPGKANVIKQPASASKKSSSKKNSARSQAGTVAAKTGTGSGASGGVSNAAEITPIHTWTLAVVAGLALLYGAYEYRADMANRIYQLRCYLKARRAGRA